MELSLSYITSMINLYIIYIIYIVIYIYVDIVYMTIITHFVIFRHIISIQIICQLNLILIDLIIYSVYTIPTIIKNIQLLENICGPPIINYILRIVY
jgi:hypothetical protein